MVMVSEDGIPSFLDAAGRQDLRCIDSLSKYLLNTCNMPGTKLGTGDPTVNKTGMVHAVTDLKF